VVLKGCGSGSTPGDPFPLEVFSLELSEFVLELVEIEVEKCFDVDAGKGKRDFGAAGV